MKGLFFLFICMIFLYACNNESKQKADTDTTKFTPVTQDSVTFKDSSKLSTDTSLLDTSRVILRLLKDQDFEKLAGYVDPSLRLRFSPYAYGDTTEDQSFTPYELRMAAKKSSVILWGSYDGTGDPIRMNIKDYFQKFVYNKDFLNAPQRAVNKMLGSGNSLNNLKQIYPSASFTEFYFPGFDPKYEGMDWQTLRLVFQKQNGRLYLIAVVHDQWTI